MDINIIGIELEQDIDWPSEDKASADIVVSPTICSIDLYGHAFVTAGVVEILYNTGKSRFEITIKKADGRIKTFNLKAEEYVNE